MTKTEAIKDAAAMNKHSNLSAEIVRILPETMDPPKPGDNGWDVRVTHLYDSRVFED